MNCVDPNDDHRRSQQREEEKNVEDQHSIQGEDDANVSAHSSRRNSTAGESNYSSKSNLNVPGSRTTQKSKYSLIHQIKPLDRQQNKVVEVKPIRVEHHPLDRLPANEMKIPPRTLSIQISLQPGVSHTRFLHSSYVFDRFR